MLKIVEAWEMALPLKAYVILEKTQVGFRHSHHVAHNCLWLLQALNPQVLSAPPKTYEQLNIVQNIYKQLTNFAQKINDGQDYSQ